MKALVVSIALLFVAGCETLPVQSNHASGQTRYECYTYDYPAKHVLTLPVPSNNAEIASVDIWFQGSTLPVTYLRDGLTQLWSFNTDGLYIQLDPDLKAGYLDFRGAEEGEERKPGSVFKCKQRN